MRKKQKDSCGRAKSLLAGVVLWFLTMVIAHGRGSAVRVMAAIWCGPFDSVGFREVGFCEAERSGLGRRRPNPTPRSVYMNISG